MIENAFSYWEQSSFLNHYDVIIIGSGIVGLNAALQLKTQSPRLKIAILERGMLPSGASTKNAGFACFGSVSELLSDIKSYGEETVFNLVTKRIKGLATLRKNLGDSAICFEQKGGYELFLKNDLQQMETAFLGLSHLNYIFKPLFSGADIFAVNNAKIADFGFDGVKGLIENKFEGQIDTGKMMLALIQKAQSLGVLIFNQTQVLSFEEDKLITIKTKEATFTTHKIVFATNAFTAQLLPEIDIKPGRGQVLVTEPIKGLKVKGTFHYDEGYYYFRDVDDRILLGGGRNIDFKAEETFDLNTSEEIQKKLEEMLYQIILPNNKMKIDYRWSGIMGFGEPLEPIVKKIRKGLFVAARCNGMGVALGSLTGMEVADLVLVDLN
ncbi:NAD(P)/FAD-dependent oxidoreductase [Pedobacter cryophilus]|uniref:FAD-binding oxidoreductase n=1 Tax=Pedobacter cryophilus TaxID=2571271 RepID=A0A4V5NXT1_9SPHI|nr:FAD-binding oxidoreductase [Pedobacter cryophilus]TKC00661.1 FAD-binding oxidoreductase [Pedobacter cryophilus]